MFRCSRVGPDEKGGTKGRSTEKVDPIVTGEEWEGRPNEDKHVLVRTVDLSRET